MRLRILLVAPLAILACCLAGAVGAGAATPVPAKQQVLRLGLAGWSEGGTLDAPILAYSDSVNLSRLFLEPLYDPSTTGALTPRLASGQPRVTNGGKRITVPLRSARWSDGVPITAADVLAAWQRSRTSYFRLFMTTVSSVRATNARTVVFDLKRPDPVIVPMLASQVVTPVPAHVIARVGNRYVQPGQLVSSGPFILTARTGTKLTGTRNPNYAFRSTSKLTGVVATVTSRAKVASGLRSGTLDIALQNALEGRDPENVAPLTTTWVRTMGSQYAYLNTTNPALKDPHVRRAIALAIDRTGIATLGHGTPLQGVLPPLAPGAAASISGPRLLGATGAPDVAAATAELGQGGWSSSTVLHVYYAASTLTESIASSIRTSLAAIGVQVQLHPTPPAKFATVGYGISPVRSNVDILLQGWIQDYADPLDWYQLFTCANVKAGLNSSNFCDRGYDSALAPLRSSFSWATRAATATKLEDLLTGPQGSMPAVPLYEHTSRMDVNARVQGLTVTADSIIHWDRLWIGK